MYLLRQDRGNEITQFGQARQQTELMEPDTEQVVNAFIGEATSGIGTLNADISAYGVTEGEKIGSPLTKDQYQQSPNYRAAIPYYRGMTEKSAEQLSIYSDESEKRAEFISDATGWQVARGYAAAFGFGMVEPKNVATGLATSFFLTPIAGAAGPMAGSVRRLMRMRQEAGQIGGKIALGAIEGGVSAAIAEPSNQYSASILRQDYTMADSAWNIALSTAFGVGASVAGIGATDVPKFVRDKWEKHGAKTPDIIATELDTAVSQLTQGKRVDVSPVESTAMGSLAAKPLEEKMSAIEKVIERQNPELVASVRESRIATVKVEPVAKAVDAGDTLTGILPKSLAGAKPRYGYKDSQFTLGFASDIDRALYITAQTTKSKSDGAYREFLTQHGYTDAQIAKMGAEIRDNIKARAKAAGESGHLDIEAMNVYQPKSKAQGELGTGYADTQRLAAEANQKYQSAIFARFGTNDINTIARQIDSENAASTQKSILDDASPDNDTAIDMAAWDQLDDMESLIPTEAEKAAYDSWQNDMKEISAMKREGMLDKADEEAMLDAFNNVNEKEIQAAWDDLYACLTRG